MLAQAIGIVVYSRNLLLIYGKMKKIHNYINGADSSSKNELPVIDPSTGEEISKVVLSSELDFNKAIESSRNALPIWSIQHL